MKSVARHLLLRLLVLVTCASIALAGAPAAAQQARFDRQALDSMLAPIALYPDALLSHVLMAATYPEEVAEAANWLRARPGLSGDAAVRASADQDWEPSVRSLLAFPMVLETLAGHMRWTEDIGSAFLYQRAEVMDTVQALRRRAYEAGTLRSNEAVQVAVTASGIVIEQARPESVYVPYYDPRVAYGGWWWPSRPPVYWPRWHGYVDPLPRGHYLSWGPAIHVGSGFFFGGFVWPRREVRVVHVHSHYYPRRVVVERHVVPGRRDPVVVHRDARPGVWRHEDWRRRDRDGNHDRRDWRRDDDRRSSPVVRRAGEPERPRTEQRRLDRDGDGVADRSRRTQDRRDGDGVADRRPGAQLRRDDAASREQWRTQNPGRDRDERSERRNDRSDNREQSRTQRAEREAPRARSTQHEAPRAAPRESERPQHRSVERQRRGAAGDSRSDEGRESRQVPRNPDRN